MWRGDNDHLLAFQRLDSHRVAKQLAKRVHEACIRDSELRDQATRAAKSPFLGLCEGLPSDSGRAFIVVVGEIRGVRSDPEVQVAFGPGSLVCGAAWLGEPQLAWETRPATRARTLVLHEEHWFDMMEEHAQLLHATLANIAHMRDGILEELAAQKGPLTVSDFGSGPVTLRWPVRGSSIDV